MRYCIISLVALIIFLADQLTKFWITHIIPLYSSINVIPDFFDLVNIRNRGAAFGFLNRSDIEWQFWLFLGATFLAIVIIFFLAHSAHSNERFLFWGLGCILGGALGNLFDRLRIRAVIDFLDFYIGDWHWPAFNVADIAICCGGFLVLISMWHNKKVKRNTIKE